MAGLLFMMQTYSSSPYFTLMGNRFQTTETTNNDIREIDMVNISHHENSTLLRPYIYYKNNIDKQKGE